MPALDNEPAVHLTLGNLKELTNVLQAIKSAAKQVCSVVVAPDGLSIRWEDDAKSLQASVYLRAELFIAYTCPTSREVFGVHYSSLVDTLSVFASSSDANLELKYPGPEGELQLEMRDDGDPCVMCTYSRVSCLEQEPPKDITDYWADPVSYFLIQGNILKEAIEDLEWPGSSVTIRLQRDPARISLKASGNGSLEVELDTRQLSGYHCAIAQVQQQYKYKNLRTAFSNIPTSKDAGSISTKVSIDANGLLKVTHMLTMLHAAGGATQHHPSTASLGFVGTQHGTMDASRVGIVQFVSLPQDDEPAD